MQTYVTSTNSRIDTINSRNVLAYVGSCAPMNGGDCKCNLNEQVMVIEAASGNTGFCQVQNQGTPQVSGRCTGGSNGARFTCFRYLTATW